MSIRDNLYGARPTAIGKDMKENAPAGTVPALREHVERGANLRQDINELLAEIEAFI